MFLGINIIEWIKEAANNIMSTVTESLGPLTTLSMTASDWRDIGIQLCATIILFLVVRFFFWKPITKILETRREAMDKALEEAEASKKNAQAIEAQLQKELDEAKAKVKEMLDTAEKEANLKRETIINDAKEEARKRLANLEVELDQEKKSMEADIRREIVDIAFAAAEKIVSREINQDKYLDVVDDILKEALN